MKLLLIISNTNKSGAFEILVRGFIDNNIKLKIILLQEGSSDFSQFLERNEVSYEIINNSTKFQKVYNFLKLTRILLAYKPHVVHAHLFEASFLAIVSSKLLGIKNRVYSRHYSTYNHDYYPKVVKFDKILNSCSSKIIAISEVVKSVLINLEKVKESKISIINHGFDLESYQSITEQQAEKFKTKYNIPISKTVVGVISRFIELKGIQYVIPAFAKSTKTNSNLHLVLVGEESNYSNQIYKLLNQYLTKIQFTIINYEPDNLSLYAIFDIFVHVPIDENIEAFGQIYIEALASKVPSIFTLSGIAKEFIIDNHNALVVEFKSSEKIYDAIEKLLVDKKLNETLKKNGANSVKQYSKEDFITNHIKLYNNLCQKKGRA